ncbi:MAG: aldose 1-epimerase family protein [Cellulomonadaceae bacterium]
MSTIVAPASGTQYTIHHGAYSATIAGVGASLRVLEHDGRALVMPYDADEVRPAYRGAVLAPWPNRVVDGQYFTQGRHHELAITEPARGHALHGLACWLEWMPEEVTEAGVVLGCVVQPQSGYPFRLHLRARFALSDAGLDWEVSATNTGAGHAPFGTAPHPYLVAGEGPIDAWTVRIPADSVLEVTAARLVPVALRAVGEYDGGSLDFRTPRPIGGTFMDHAFGDVLRGPDGCARVEVRAPSGTGVAMSWDASCPWVQVHTPQAPGPGGYRASLAVEPMTCPPDAFNSGTDLVVLPPGGEHTARWRICAL